MNSLKNFTCSPKLIFIQIVFIVLILLYFKSNFLFINDNTSPKTDENNFLEFDDKSSPKEDKANFVESKIVECRKFSDLTSFCIYENICLENNELIFLTKNQSLTNKKFDFNGKINNWDHYQETDNSEHPINDKVINNPLPFRSFLDGHFDSSSIWHKAKTHAKGCHSVLNFDSPNQNIFHWSIKISPLFIYLNFYKNILCPAFDSIQILNRKYSDLSDWQRNFLEISTDTSLNNVIFKPKKLQCFKYLLVPGTAIYVFTGPKEAIHFRQKIGKKLSLEYTRSRVVIVKRKNRFIVNQDELDEFIKSKIDPSTLDIVYFEDLNFEQQVTKMSQTKLLISVHGAGLTNSIFLPSTSVVLEITPPHFHYPLYERVVTQSGHIFFRFVSEPDTSIHSGKYLYTKSRECFKNGDCIVFWKDKNIRVNMTKFSFLFEQILEVL